MTPRSLTAPVLLSACLVLYLSFALARLEQPGLEYDETIFVNAALGDIDGTFVEWSIPFFGRRLPVMLMTYVGALKSWLYAPVFAVAGTGAAAIRGPAVLLGLLAIVLTYRLVRAQLGLSVALVSTTLLALDPAFIFPVRLDWGPVALMTLLKMAALCLLWRWLEGGGTWRLALAAFAMGLGLFDKVVFVWFLGAMAIAVPLAFWRKLRPRLDRRSVAAFLAGFALGAAPFLAYNALHPFRSLEGPAVRSVGAGAYLKYRIWLFRGTLNGTSTASVVNDQSLEQLVPSVQKLGAADSGLVAWLCRHYPLRGTLSAWGLAGALAALAALALAGRLDGAPVVLFHALELLLTALFIGMTPQATGPHHAFMIQPFPQILVATALCQLGTLLPTLGSTLRACGRVAAGAAFALLVGANAAVDLFYLESFRLQGGAGKWSDAIYDLARWAGEQSDRTFLLMDWGFSCQLLALSGGRIHKEEAFTRILLAPDMPAQVAELERSFDRPNAILIFHAPRYETYPVLRVLNQALARGTHHVRSVRVFRERGGAPIYIALEAASGSVPGMSDLVNPDFMGYEERPGVRVEVSPALVRAGSATLEVRVVNFPVPAIDLRYMLDGVEMPPIYGWTLDERFTARVFADATTPRGVYRYVAIRDARDPSPSAWVRVDATVEVR
jgi:4-amino-4-deoxy-L-arabinose transferase-like glycosyltransferase